MIKNRGLGFRFGLLFFFFSLLHTQNINTTVCSSLHLQKWSINGLLGYIAHLFPITAPQQITFFPESSTGMDSLTASFPGDPGGRSWNTLSAALTTSLSAWHEQKLCPEMLQWHWREQKGSKRMFQTILGSIPCLYQASGVTGQQLLIQALPSRSKGRALPWGWCLPQRWVRGIFFISQALSSLCLLGSEPQTLGSKSILSCSSQLSISVTSRGAGAHPASLTGLAQQGVIYISMEQQPEPIWGAGMGLTAQLW